MIICLCRGKSDRDVLAAIDDGAMSVSDLQACGIGTDCGACHGDLRAMLARAAMPVAAVAHSLPEPAEVLAGA
ncbi:MAG: (2Fe-2S)-binding protein [Thermoanaerobaculia bacterium]